MILLLGCCRFSRLPFAFPLGVDSMFVVDHLLQFLCCRHDDRGAGSPKGQRSARKLDTHVLQ